MVKLVFDIFIILSINDKGNAMLFYHLNSLIFKDIKEINIIKGDWVYPQMKMMVTRYVSDMWSNEYDDGNWIYPPSKNDGSQDMSPNCNSIMTYD